MSYEMPDYLTTPTNRYDAITNMAHFLMHQDLTIFDTWVGEITFDDQQVLFGRNMGDKPLTINGLEETVKGRKFWDMKSGVVQQA